MQSFRGAILRLGRIVAVAILAGPRPGAAQEPLLYAAIGDIARPPIGWVEFCAEHASDCEDYVLLKRRMLMEAGWPREALLITVVRETSGDGHAVLTVRTDRGDFVLDNQNAAIVLWSESGYRFVKRQSQSDPNIWVSLGDPRPSAATATSR